MTKHETALVQLHLIEQQQAIIERIIMDRNEVLTVACLTKIVKEAYSIDDLKENLK